MKFRRSMLKNILSASILISSSSCVFAAALEGTVTAQALNALSSPHNPAYLTSTHHASVTNNTDTVQTITVRYTICAIGCNTDHHYKIRVNPHATWADGLTLHLTPRYPYAGNYTFTATTSVEGPGLNETFTAPGFIEIR